MDFEVGFKEVLEAFRLNPAVGRIEDVKRKVVLPLAFKISLVRWENVQADEKDMKRA